MKKADDWLSFVLQHVENPKKTRMILLGTTSDCASKVAEEVNLHDNMVKELRSKYQIRHEKVSAKTGENVEDAINKFMYEVLW